MDGKPLSVRVRQGGDTALSRRLALIVLVLASLLSLGAWVACSVASYPSEQSGAVQGVTPVTRAGSVRMPAVAGTFYPAEPQALRKMVEDLMSQQTQRGPAPIALIVPHAGYGYSGSVAASAFKQLDDREYDAIVVLGTNHRAPGFDKISIWPSGAYSTPMGVLPIDESLAQELLDTDPERIVADSSVQLAEHSIEVELPFLFRLFGSKPFVPIMIGAPSWENCVALSNALVEVLTGRRAVIIGSTDLSHYPPYELAVSVDTCSMLAMSSLDPQAVVASTAFWMARAADSLACTMCGEGPVLTTLLAAQGLGADRASVLHYANSGDVSFGDRTGVVGYAALMLWRGEELVPGSAYEDELLRIARTALRAGVEGQPAPELVDLPPVLQQPQGAFVTLKNEGELRGCVGNIWGTEPLARTVQRMAAAAAREGRFSPVTALELDELRIEVSILSPLRYVDNTDEIEVGRDGLYITDGTRAGVLLPQVASEEGWGRAEFLHAVCAKAGLREDAWQQGALLFSFEARVLVEGR